MWVSKETLVLHRWGVLQDNLVLTTGLICELATIKRLESWPFELRLETSAFGSLYGGQFTYQPNWLNQSIYNSLGYSLSTTD